jgi:nucleoside-diphosphate-sugar epimerase
MTVLTANGSFADAYVKQFKADVASFRELDEATFIKKISSAKTIIHNAATIKVDGIESAVTRNFDFTRFLVTKLEELNPEVQLIFISSMSILDPADDQLYGDVLHMSPYAYSKYLAETYCLKSKLKHVSCVRFSTLFYQDPVKDGLSKLVSDAVHSKEITIFNKGEARRNFLPLHIAAQYVQKLTDKNELGKKTLNLAAPQSSSFRDIASLLQKLVKGLEVKDQAYPNPSPVLAEFNTDDIQQLGQIEFSLEDEIASYIKALSS